MEVGVDSWTCRACNLDNREGALCPLSTVSQRLILSTAESVFLQPWLSSFKPNVTKPWFGSVTPKRRLLLFSFKHFIFRVQMGAAHLGSLFLGTGGEEKLYIANEAYE